MHMPSLIAYNIALASSELDVINANVTKNDWEQPYSVRVVKPRPFPKNVWTDMNRELARDYPVRGVREGFS